MYCAPNDSEKLMFDSVKMFMNFTSTQKSQFFSIKLQRDSSSIQSTYESIQRFKVKIAETKESIQSLENAKTLAKCSAVGSTTHESLSLDASLVVISTMLKRDKMHLVDLERYLARDEEIWNELVKERRSNENAFGIFFTSMYGVCHSHPENMWLVWDLETETKPVCAGCGYLE